jgi:hypothetical protein
VKHWHLGLLAGAAAFLVTSSAQAAPNYRVIQWDFTRICQIYDFGWGGRPIPSNYRVLTPPLRTSAPRCVRRASWRVTAAAQSNGSIKIHLRRKANNYRVICEGTSCKTLAARHTILRRNAA